MNIVGNPFGFNQWTAFADTALALENPEPPIPPSSSHKFPQPLHPAPSDQLVPQYESSQSKRSHTCPRIETVQALHDPRYVEYVLGSTNPKPFPTHLYPTLPDFCEALIRKFSSSRLHFSAKNRIGAAALPRPPEAQFQDEFYCALQSILGHGHRISSELSRSDKGRIDFLITGTRWGIELLRDGDRLTEHCERFMHNGAYHQWIANGWMHDWIILDCTHKSPNKYSESMSIHFSIKEFFHLI